MEVGGLPVVVVNVGIVEIDVTAIGEGIVVKGLALTHRLLA